MNKFNSQSSAMSFFRVIGLERVAWSLRRLHCPVDHNALVLEVGSGGNPYARANVLLDAYEETNERHWVPLKADRPMVLGFVEKLPFKDKSFDFVIASHVFEHSPQPEQFLAELQRVAKAGYIEVPDAFMERINPYIDHRLEITCRDEKLIIRKKLGHIVEHDTVELYESRVKPFLTCELIPKRPFAFHVRYYWHEKIAFKVLNPEADASWMVEVDSTKSKSTILGIKARVQAYVLDIARLLLSQSKRNKKIEVFNLLICPSCGCDSLTKIQQGIQCDNCNVVYPVKNDIPYMYPV
jgi:SAM-dependent methyltransferase